MKNISREEVVEFLKDKGLGNDDINYAYEKAQEQAMSPEERIRYLKTQVATREKEIKDSRAFTRHLSEQVAEKSEQITTMQNALEKAAARILALQKDSKTGTAAPPEVLKEMQSAMNKLSNQINSSGDKMGSSGLFQKDLAKLKNVSTNAEAGNSFVAYLYLQSLEAVDLNTMRQTQAFFAEFEE